MASPVNETAVLLELANARTSFYRYPRSQAESQIFLNNETTFLSILLAPRTTPNVRNTNNLRGTDFPIDYHLYLFADPTGTQRSVPRLLSPEEITSATEEVGSGDALRNEACSICHDSMAEGRVYKLRLCNHAFHAGCIRSWLGVGTRCPLCRVDLRNSQEETTNAR